MFRQIKSAIIWTYIYRFRVLLIKIFIAFILILTIEFIYRDVMEFLQISHQVEFLIYALLIKWLLFFSVIFYIGWSLYQSFKKQEYKKKCSNKQVKETKEKIALTAEQLIQQKIKKKKGL